MAIVAAIVATIAGVAIVFQLAKNVGTAGSPTTGFDTLSKGATSITSTLFSK